MSTTKAALLGFGVVGSEVYGYFQESPVIDISSVLIKDNDKPRTYKVHGETRDLDRKVVASSYEAILNDKDIKVVIELTGIQEAGEQFILPALERGKHVVTANKEAMLSNWARIAALSAAKGLVVRYDATVGGGVPIIRCFEQHLSQDRISKVFGILNGTCNHILSGMRAQGSPHIL